MVADDVDAQVHLKELEKYWPKFITGTMIEVACYLVLFPDLFNLVVIIKTSVLLVLWMRGKKQWEILPLRLFVNADPVATRVSQQDPRSSGSSAPE